jgi:hypothetical protein
VAAHDLIEINSTIRKQGSQRRQSTIGITLGSEQP